MAHRLRHADPCTTAISVSQNTKAGILPSPETEVTVHDQRLPLKCPILCGINFHTGYTKISSRNKFRSNFHQTAMELVEKWLVVRTGHCSYRELELAPSARPCWWLPAPVLVAHNY